jgi:MFS transporter, FHS family, L-fucose permease
MIPADIYTYSYASHTDLLALHGTFRDMRQPYVEYSGRMRMAAPMMSSDGTGVAGVQNDKTRIVLLLVFAVFFILGGVTNINDVLIPKFKSLFQLSHFQANLVQFAFFTSYALFSIPAGRLLSRIGYVRGFVAGFMIIAFASLLFLPAAYSGQYIWFLVALFVLGGGITLLQVAMNPVTLSLGKPETAHSRLTFAQLFNSIGVFLMIYGGAQLLLGESSSVDPATLSPAALDAFRISEATVIGHAYIGLAVAMTLIALIFWMYRAALDGQEAESAATGGALALLKSHPRLAFGALCIFCYVGAEVTIGSNLIAYLGDDRTMGLSAKDAGKLLSLYWGGALVGRFIGSFLLRVVKPGTMLLSVAGAAVALNVISGFSSGAVAGWSLILVGLFNSIMFPTIFSLATENMHKEAPQASGILCTAIVGGALIPPLFGQVADMAGLAAALIVPIICYAIIVAFGLYANRVRAAG